MQNQVSQTSKLELLGKGTFVMEKSDRHHLNQVVKLNITKNRAKEPYKPSDVRDGGDNITHGILQSKLFNREVDGPRLSYKVK